MTSAKGKGGETLEDQCLRLQEERTAAEHDKMSSDYQSHAGVDRVTGAVGPLFYANVVIEGTPVEAMIDPRSFATIDLRLVNRPVFIT